MPKHFRVHELLGRVELDALEEFTREPGRTIDQIHEWLLSRGYTIGRSAAGTWRDKFLLEDRQRVSSEMARSMMEARKGNLASMSDAAADHLAQMIYEAGVEMQLSGKVSAKDLVALTAAQKNNITSKRHLETLKEEMASRQKLAVAEADKLAKAGGSADAVVDKVREVLGIGKAA